MKIIYTLKNKCSVSLCLVAALLLVSLQINAAYTYTWTNTGTGGSWSTAGNWTRTGSGGTSTYPGSAGTTDIVVIAPSASITITNVPTATLASFTESGSNTVALSPTTTNTLTITTFAITGSGGAVVLNSSMTCIVKTTLNLTAGSISGNGTFTVGAAATLTTNVVAGTLSASMTTYNITGKAYQINYQNTSPYTTGGELPPTTVAPAGIDNYSGQQSTNNMLIEGSAGVTLGASGGVGALCIAQASGAVLHLAGYTLNITGSYANLAANVSSGSGGTNGLDAGTGASIGTLNFLGGGYSLRFGNQYISGTQTYVNLTFQNSITYGIAYYYPNNVATSGGSMYINNLNVVTGTVPLSYTGYVVNLYISGNITNGGTLNEGEAGANVITLSGTGAQTLSGSGTWPTTYTSYTVNNTYATAPQVTVNCNLPIPVTLTLTDGIVTTGSGNYINVTSTATGAVTGASSSSYIKGAIKWALLASVSSSGTSYIFPVGDSYYRPLGLINVLTGATSPVMEVTVASSGASTFNSPIQSIANPTTWEVQVLSGNFTSSTIQLTDTNPVATDLVGQASAQAGAYSSIGNASEGASTINSNSGVTNSGTSYFTLGSTIIPSSVTITDDGTQIQAGNVAPGANGVVLYQTELAVSGGATTLNGFTCTLAGSPFTTGDVSNLYLYYSTNSSYSAGSPVQLGSAISSPATGTQTFSGLTQSLPVGNNYLYIVANIAGGATVNDNVNINSVTSGNFMLAANAAIASVTTSNGGAQTIATTSPTIAISDDGTQVQAADVAPGTTGVVLYQAALNVTNNSSTLNALTCTLASTLFTSGDVSKLYLYYSGNSSFTGGSPALLGTAISNPATGSQNFTGLTQSLAVGNSYLYVVADFSGGATANDNVNINALSAGNFTFAAGATTGSVTTTAGGSQTITTPTITITDDGTQVQPGNVSVASSNLVLHQSNVVTSVAAAPLTGVTFSTVSGYAAADLADFKLWSSSSSTFSAGSATLLSTLTTSLGPGSHSFSFSQQLIPTGVPVYFYITADLGSGNTLGDYFNANAPAFNFNGNMTNSCTAGGAQTIVTAIYYNSTAGATALQLLGSWGIAMNGSGTAPASFTANNQQFNITNGSATPTIGANWTVSGTNSIVNVGNGSTAVTFTIPSAYTYSSGATTVTAGATVVNQNASVTSLGTCLVYGTYTHAVASGTVPTATWESPNGNCQITGTTSTVTVPGGLNQAFQNFTWNCAGMTGNTSLANAMNNVTINGYFQAVNTSGYYLYLAQNANTTLTVKGDMYVGPSSAYIHLANGTGLGTLNLYGSLILSTNAGVQNSSTARNGVINFLGTNDSINASTSLYFNRDNYPVEVNVSSSTKLTVSASMYIDTITVASGGGIDFGTFQVSKGTSTNIHGAVYLNSGATLYTSNTGGICGNASTTGSIATAVMSNSIFSSGANYTFNAATTSAFPTAQLGTIGTINTLTANAAITLGGSITVSGGLALNNSSTLSVGASNLTYSGTGSNITGTGNINASTSGNTIVNYTGTNNTWNAGAGITQTCTSVGCFIQAQFATLSGYNMFGFCTSAFNNTSSTNYTQLAFGLMGYGNDVWIYENGTDTYNSSTSFTATDYLSVYINTSTGKVEYWKNRGLAGQVLIYTSTQAAPTFPLYPAVCMATTGQVINNVYVGVNVGGAIVQEPANFNLLQNVSVGSPTALTFTNASSSSLPNSLFSTNSIYTLNAQNTGSLAFGTGSISIVNLTMNGSGGVTLGGATTVGGPLTLNAAESFTGLLTLTNGIINTTSSNILNLTNTSASAISGGSSSSFVEGPMTWTLLPNISTTGTTYSYPVGDLGGNYRPLSLVNVNTGATSPIVEVTVAQTGALTYNSPFTSINPRNWQVQNTNGGNLISGVVQLTETGLQSGNSLIGQSSSAAGAYSSVDASNVTATTISSIVLSPPTGYFAVGGSTITPNLTLSDNGTQVGAANVSPGTANVVLHQSQLYSTPVASTITGLTCTTAGTYATADITDLKVYYSTSNTFNAGSATLLSTINSPAIAGAQSFSSFTPQTIIANSNGYIYVTADIAPGAATGHTISVNALATSNFTFSATVNISGSTSNGGAQTIEAPTISISDNSPQVSAASVAGGTSNVVLHQSAMAITVSDAILSGLSCVTAGNYATSDITDMKVYYSTSNTFSVGTATLLSTLSSPGIAGTQNFLSFTSQTIAAGSTGYIYITADITPGATPGHTINVNALGTSNYTFITGSLTGSTSNGGAQTITPTIFYNKASGATALNVLSNWGVNTDGSGISPASFTTSNTQYNIINGGTSPTISGNWTVSGANSLVNVGNGSSIITFTIPSGYIYSSVATNILNSDTLKNSNVSVTSLGACTVANGGTYQHNADGGTVPIATWGASSLCYITGLANSGSFSFGSPSQTFGNVTWYCANQDYNELNLGNTLNTIMGNFDIARSQGWYIALNANANANLTVYGNMIVADSINGSYFDLGSGTGIGTLNLYGNLTIGYNGGVTSESTIGNDVINFVGTGTQVFDFIGIDGGLGSTHSYLNWNYGAVNFNVNAGSTLQLASKIPLRQYTYSGGTASTLTVATGATINIGTDSIIASGGPGDVNGGTWTTHATPSFVLQSGATLITANPNGLYGSTGNGSIQKGINATYTAGANYIFNGATTTAFPTTTQQVTFGNPNNLTVNASIRLNRSITVTDSLNLNSGILKTGSSNLTLALGGTLTGSPFSTGNMIQADSAGQYIIGIGVIGSNTTYTLPVGDGTPYYTPVTLNFSSNTAAGTVGVNVTNSMETNMDNPATPYVYLNRYWTFSNSSLSNYTYTGTFSYPTAELSNASLETSMHLSQWGGSSWSEFSGSSASSGLLTESTALTQATGALSGDFTGRTLCGPIAAPTSGGDVTICASAAPGTISASSAGNVIDWYDASTGGDLLLSGSNTYPASTAGTYYAQARTAVSGCISSSRTQVTLTINANPTAVISGTLTGCISPGIMLGTTGSSAGSGTITGYQWANSSGNINGATGSTYSATASDNYSVIITNSNQCSATSSASAVTANANPMAIISGTLTGCASPGITLGTTGSVAGSGTISGYQWANSSGNINGATNSTYTATASDNYTVVVTNSNGCSATSTASAVTANANPSVPVSDGDVTICASSVPGTVSANSAGNVIDWYDASTAGGLLESASNTYTSSTSGTYYAEARNTTTGCVSTSRTPVTLTINPLPAQYDVTGGLCVPADLGLSNSDAGIDYYLQLNGVNTGVMLSGNGSTLDFGYQSSPGVYNIKAVNTATTCTDTMLGVYDVSICTATWTGSSSTNWFDPTNWNPQAVPNVCGVTVIIGNGFTNYPNISGANVNVGNVEISAGASITLDRQTLSVCGNWTGGSGTNASVGGTGTLILSGSVAQTISGNTEFNILQVSNTEGGVSLTSNAAVSIATGLQLAQGNIDVSAGSLTLLSSSSTNNSYIDDFSAGFTGTITGNIVAQRYVPVEGSNQHFISSPVSTPAFSQLGASGSPDGEYVNPTADCDETQSAYQSPYGTVFQYNDGHMPNGGCMLGNWQIRETGNTQDGRGYSVYLTGNQTLSLTGPANTGDLSIGGLNNSGYQTVSTLQGAPIQSGWNLVGNPYPSALNMTNLRANFGAQVQLWQTTGPFAGSWQSALITENGLQLADLSYIEIAPFQAFMVEVSAGAGQYAYNFLQSERVRTTDVPFYRTSEPDRLVLDLDYNGSKDVVSVAFNSSATFGYDPAFDAYKQDGSAGRPTLYTYFDNQDAWYSINSVPALTQSTAVPMGLRPENSGTMTITPQNIESFDPTTYIYLEDKQTGGAWTNLRNGAYTFTTTTSDNQQRFVLHFAPPAIILTQDASCQTPGMINIQQPGPANWNYTVTDVNNVAVSSGVLNSNNPVLASVTAGVYTITLTDNNGYTVVKTVQVQGSESIVASFGTSQTTTQVSDNVVFTSTTADASAYSWDFGDGTTGSGQQATHSYQSAGVYTVTLMVTGGSGCISSTSQTVTVTSRSVTGVSNLGENNLNIWSYENTVFVDFSKVSNVDAEVQLYNVLGQLLSDERFGKSTLYRKAIDNLDAAYIIVRVKNNDSLTTQKVFIKSK